MDVTGCEEQVGAVAERLNGEETDEPLPGLLTVMPSLDAADEDELEEDVLDDPETVIATLTVHEPPPLPQDFTCSVWEPALALTVAPTVVLSTMVVCELLSSE